MPSDIRYQQESRVDHVIGNGVKPCQYRAGAGYHAGGERQPAALGAAAVAMSAMVAMLVTVVMHVMVSMVVTCLRLMVRT